jgi:hypothetical protein
VYTQRVIKEDSMSYLVTGPIASIHMSDRVIPLWTDTQLRRSAITSIQSAFLTTS